MKINITIFLMMMLVPSITFAQKSKRKNKGATVSGTYRHVGSDNLSGASLTLKSNGTFIYAIGGDISINHSNGSWKLKGDTLILNSAMSPKNIPIVVTEEVIDSIKKNVSFSVVKNLDNDVMNATISFNDDTTKQCEPFLGMNCKIEIGLIHKFKVHIGNNASTEWYLLKNLKSNKITVTIPIHDVLDRYLFFVDERLILSKDNIYPIPRRSTKTQNVNGENSMIEISLKKMSNKR